MVTHSFALLFLITSTPEAQARPRPTPDLVVDPLALLSDQIHALGFETDASHAPDALGELRLVESGSLFFGPACWSDLSESQRPIAVAKHQRRIAASGGLSAGAWLRVGTGARVQVELRVEGLELIEASLAESSPTAACLQAAGLAAGPLQVVSGLLVADSVVARRSAGQEAALVLGGPLVGARRGALHHSADGYAVEGPVVLGVRYSELELIRGGEL